MPVLFRVFKKYTKNELLFFNLFRLLFVKHYFSNSLHLPKAPLDPKEAPGELPGGPKESPRARLGTLWRSRELSSTPQRQLFGPNVRGRHPAGANRRCRVEF